MKIIRALLDLVLYSNVFIALCAVALVFTNQLSTGNEIHLDNRCWFVFFSTVFAYCALKFRSDANAGLTTHRTWAGKHRLLQRNILVVSFVASAAFFVFLDHRAQAIIVGLALFTAFYGYVNLPFTEPKKKLRDFGLVKTAFVALVWSVTTVLVPFASNEVATDSLIFLLIRRFLFVWALTMVFEVKDIKEDRLGNIRTLPMVIGVDGTKLAAQLMLLLLICINVIQYFFFQIPMNNMLAVNASLLLSIICIQPVTEDTGDKWYFLILDGMMFLQFVFVYAAHIWFV